MLRVMPFKVSYMYHIIRMYVICMFVCSSKYFSSLSAEDVKAPVVNDIIPKGKRYV